MDALAAGTLRGAQEAYGRAVRAAPGDASLPHRMAGALARAGRRQDALTLHFEALRLGPTRAHRRALVQALHGVDLAGASPAARDCLVALLRADDVSPLDVAPAALSALSRDAGVAALARAAETGDGRTLAAALGEPAVQALLREPLWLWLLARAMQTALPVEGLLAALRRQALRSLGRPESPAGLIAPSLEPLAALAAQADLSSHAWLETEAETAAIAALARDWPASPSGELDARTLLLAAYRPLPSVEPVPSLSSNAGPLLVEVYDRLLLAPHRRRQIADELPSLTPVATGVSETVRSHYEANPYPRWLATNLPEPRPLPVVLRSLFPWLAEGSLPDPRPLPLLVAGCGTGEQALRSACRFAEAKVLAVDLSKSALAYGRERAQALGIANIRFAQADILGLGTHPERFALVECVGVPGSGGIGGRWEDTGVAWKSNRARVPPLPPNKVATAMVVRILV